MDHILLDTFVNLAIISLLIAIAPIIAKASRIPIVVVEMCLGCVGLYFGIFESSESLALLAKVGFLFLMFLCGMEVDLRGFQNLGKKFIKNVITYLVVLYGISVAVVLTLGLNKIFIAAFPVMSLGMIMTLIKDYGKDKQWLELALRVGVVGEVVSIAALTLINGIYHYGNSWKLYENLAVLCVFILGIVGLFWIFKILFWWFPTLKLYAMPYDDLSNQDIRFVMMLFVMLIALVLFLDLEPALGAFLAGMIVTIFFSYKHEMVHKLNDIGFGFFVPLFFVYVGSTLDLRLIGQNLTFILHGAYIALGMITIRYVAANVAFRKYFKHPRDVALFALSDSMPLTFLVATAKIASDWNAITQEVYYTFILAAMIEGVVFSIIIKMIYNLWKPKNLQNPQNLKNPQNPKNP